MIIGSVDMYLFYILFILVAMYFLAKIKNGKYAWISISAIVVYMIFNIAKAIKEYNPIAMSKPLFSIIMIKVIAFGILILIQYLLARHFRKANNK